MINKKAQGEIITTVLIILLVLAAIVIVWQVVNSTISKGAKQVESQSSCIGFGFDPITSIDSTNFIIKRTSQGGTFKTSELIVLIDGTRKILETDYSINFVSPLKSPLDTVTITTTDEPDKIEVGLMGDGATCPATVIWVKPVA